MGYRFLQRRGTAAEWEALNSILGPGEFGIETDTDIIKLGDGVTAWLDLPPAFEGAFLPIGGKAADSDKLDGADSSAYLTVVNAAATYKPKLVDTGWVTTDLTITSSSEFTVTAYALRRIDNHVFGSVTATYTGTTVTADASGNFTDKNGALVLPVGWRKANNNYQPIEVARVGWPSYIGRYASSVGSVDLVAGLFNAQTIPTSTSLIFMFDHYTD